MAASVKCRVRAYTNSRCHNALCDVDPFRLRCGEQGVKGPQSLIRMCVCSGVCCSGQQSGDLAPGLREWQMFSNLCERRSTS